MLGIVPSGCVYSFDMYVFRLGDEILVAGGEKIIERLAAAYRLARSKEQVRLFSPSSGGGRRRTRRGGFAESVFSTSSALHLGLPTAPIAGARGSTKRFTETPRHGLLPALGRAVASLGLPNSVANLDAAFFGLSCPTS
jgi:hypothetical protein